MVKDFFAAMLLGLASFIASLLVFKESFRGLFVHKIPLAGDGLLTGLYIQAVEKSSYFSLLSQNIKSNRFGWPGQLDFSSYPVGNTQEMFAIKIFMDLTGITDPSQIIHIFSISKALPIAIAAFILARVLGINRIISFGIGILFSLNTFNLVRAEGHFFLAFTWSLPLGLAAIFISFQLVHKGLPQSRRHIGSVISLGLLSFLSGYYFSLFLLILSLTSLIFLAIFTNLNVESQNFTTRIKTSIRTLFLPLLTVFLFILGLFVQTFPVLSKGKLILSLTGLADRSSVESIIYAGTPESLLFDLYSFGLRILKRPDLVAYLQSRISWEGSQVGALSGLFLVALLTFMLTLGLFRLLGVSTTALTNRIQLETSTVFVSLMLTITLLLYFVSPINFTVSRVLPQIRAWGRLSVVIALLTLLLVGMIISRFKKTDSPIWLIASLILLIPLAELNQFHINRPPSAALNASNLTQELDLRTTLKDLKSKFPKDCAVINLPIYPFPEFDRPDDQNIDYGQLQLPILDDGYFQWSYAGIKATQNFARWQPLVSEFPPFSRARISSQIEYAYAVGACGSLIDRTYLNESEMLDLEKLSINRCTSELMGTRLENRARYVSVSYLGDICQLNISPSIEKLVSDSASEKMIWRIDQSSTLGFQDVWQIFPYTSSINARVKTAARENPSNLFLRIRVLSPKPLNTLKLNICISNLETSEKQCVDFSSDGNGFGEVRLPQSLLGGKVARFSASLTSYGESELSSWGIHIGMRK